MASEEEVRMRDSSDDTKETRETARRLLPSEAVREFSSRDQVLRGNRINSSLTLITNDDCLPKDDKLDPPQPTQKSGDVESEDQLPSKLKTLVEANSMDELRQELRDLIDSKMSHVLQLVGERIKQHAPKTNDAASVDKSLHKLQKSSDVDSMDELRQELRDLDSRMSHTFHLLDERFRRVEKDVDALNESNRGNIGLNMQQASSGTAVGTPQEMEPFIDEDQHVDPQDTGVKAGESNTKEQVGLNPDSFSFLISARPLSIPFVTGLLAFALKNAIFYLVMINLMDLLSPFNKLGIPVTVSTAVLISQVLAFGISVFTQNDLVTGLVLLYHGFSQDVTDVYGQRDGVTGGGGRFGQWLFAVFCLFGDGLFGLAVTFMLIMTSSTVLDVLLNFAAVEFVAGLDEAVFSLCAMGFLGHTNRLEAAHVSESTYQAVRSRSSKMVRAMGLTGTLVVVLSLWAYLFSLQVRGVYAPQTLFVQFDDQVRPELAAHSGVYVLKTNTGAGPSNRFHYDEDRVGGGRFGYCPTNREWTFSVGSTVDPCDYTNVLVKSIETQTFDMTQVAGETWFVFRESVDQAIPMKDFFMAIVCQRADDCSGRGRCTRDNRCECQEGTFGVQCEHDANKTCPAVNLDERFETQFQAVRPVSTAFDLVPNISVYNRPVYVNATTNDTIVFTGVRWAVTNFDGLQISDVDQLESLEEQGWFQGNNIRVDLLSDRVLYQTPYDSETAPVGVHWWVVSNRGSLRTAQLVEPLNPMVLLCSTCSADNPCSFDNICDGAVCQCGNGGSGTLCQIAPLSDGKCDLFFNTPEFAYDGGDCCQATCVGTLDNQCGVVSVGSVPNIDIGFPHCIDPDVIGHCKSAASIQTCFIRASKPFRWADSGFASLSLSANGRVLVLGEPSIGIVRVFDLVGSEWVQRGRTLRGINGAANFGQNVAVSTPPAAVINGATVKIPIVLVVSSWASDPSMFGYTFYVFRWTSSSVDWTEQEPITEYITVAAMEVATDFVSSTRLLVKCYPSGLKIYDITGNGTHAVEIIDSDEDIIGALSGDGRFLARTRSDTEPTIVLSDLRNNITSEMDVPGMTFPDRIIGMRLVGTYYSFADAEYSELGLSVVVHTGRDENETDLVAVWYFAVEMADGTTFAMRAAVETKVKGSRTIFSSDGSSLFLQDDGIWWRPFFLNNARTQWLQALPKPWASIGPSISSGNGRIRVVDGSAGTLQVMESATVCSPDEFTFRLVIIPGVAIDGITWSVFEYGTYEGYVFSRNDIRSCSRCYNNPSLSETALLEELCLPKPLPNCLAFQVSALFVSDVNGFAAYLIDGNNATLVEADEGFRVDGRNYFLSGGGCEADPVPPNCPFPLVIAYKFNFVEVTYEVSSAGALAQFGFLSGASVDIVCMASPNCGRLTIYNRFSTYGDGDYAAFYNGTKITSGVWHSGLHDSVRFGMGC